jgi:hypothetical protein
MCNLIQSQRFVGAGAFDSLATLASICCCAPARIVSLLNALTEPGEPFCLNNGSVEFVNPYNPLPNPPISPDADDALERTRYNMARMIMTARTRKIPARIDPVPVSPCGLFSALILANSLAFATLISPFSRAPRTCWSVR